MRLLMPDMEQDFTVQLPCSRLSNQLQCHIAIERQAAGQPLQHRNSLRRCTVPHHP